MTELTAYRDFVADALVRSLDLPEGVIFGNSTAEHARVVMDTIIDNARNELKLMARALSSEVHDPYHLQKALQNSKDLGVQVIVDPALGDAGEVRTLGMVFVDTRKEILPFERLQETAMRARQCSWQEPRHGVPPQIWGPMFTGS